MHFLGIFTIICSGLMIGNEFAVSAFVNPAIWQLDGAAEAKAAILLARSLGKVMPFWYTLCLILMGIEAYLHRYDASLRPLLFAVVVWSATIIYTVALLVPINNRIAALTLASPRATWKQDHKKWDTLHRWRIVLLIIAMAGLTYALVRPD
ncbi:MAG TPA: DUF1772 domain-containing protein [Bryobacteraceae bacterium]|jgi:uncharacterized membrane protein|nr:DUF1772 domain-containing protein [Bryobacteraceae bacterium]